MANFQRITLRFLATEKFSLLEPTKEEEANFYNYYSHHPVPGFKIDNKELFLIANLIG